MTQIIQSALTTLRAGEWMPSTAARVLIGIFFCISGGTKLFVEAQFDMLERTMVQIHLPYPQAAKYTDAGRAVIGVHARSMLRSVQKEEPREADMYIDEIVSKDPRTRDESVARVDMKLEAVVIPVSDVNRAKKFYANLGWRLDADFPFDNGFRLVQFTPPGSGCSIQFGTKIASAAPGSAQGLYLIVSCIEAAREELVACGVTVSEAFYVGTPGAQFQPNGTSGRVCGRAPDHASYGSYATFSDPDGNGWLLQEVTTRLPGRIDRTETVFASPSDLASALRRAETAHGQHEKRTGQRDVNWPDWYAEYMVAEQAGKEDCPQ